MKSGSSKSGLLIACAALGLLLAGGSSAARADAVIEIRLSFKVIVDLNGNPPTGHDVYEVYSSLTEMNDFMLRQSRGFRFTMGPILEIGGTDPDGPSKRFGIGFPTHADAGEAESDPRYLWDPNAINIYISGGFARQPGLLVDVELADEGMTILHEIGHYFMGALAHTAPDQDSLCDTLANIGDAEFAAEGFAYRHYGVARFSELTPNQQAFVVVTITRFREDYFDPANGNPAYWEYVRDGIAIWHFGGRFAELSASQQWMVLDLDENVMSQDRYSTDPDGPAGVVPARHRLSEGQLDRFTARLNTSAVADGRVHFVGARTPTALSGCLSGSVLGAATVSSAILAASAAGNDIVLIRPGSYDEQLLLDRPVTLRATLKGPATIGVP